MELVFGWLLFSVLVGWFASTRGRSGVLAFLVATLLSPLIGFVIYLIAGESADAVRKRIIDEEKIRDEFRNPKIR